VSPSSRGLWGGVAHHRRKRNPKQVLAISGSARGYTLAEVDVDLRTVVVHEALLEQTLLARVQREGQHGALYVHTAGLRVLHPYHVRR
jgi:hypothetical protein